MIQVLFQSSGIRYSLVVLAESRREREARSLDIKPDPTLWTRNSKHKLTGGDCGDTLTRTAKQRGWKEHYKLRPRVEEVSK